MVNMIEVFKQMVAALEDTSASKHISRNAAIQAGLKAIAELESQKPDVVMHWHSHTWTTINPPPKNSGDVNLYYAPPQRTESEPVAYINVEMRRLEFAHDYVKWDTPTTIKLDKIPLYTHLPQRT